MKPAVPTPPNIQEFSLSLLDQLYPSPLYPTFVLFYPNPWGTTSVPPPDPQLVVLRDSLSKTLSHFYPLAGRIKQDNPISTIFCNDQGAEFIEAEANQDMLQFLGSSPAPNIQLLSLLAPPRPRPQISSDMPLACVQITMFPCGGFSLGICFHHIIADAHTLSMLLHHWSAIARGDSYSNQNKLAHDKASSLFPTNDAVFNSKSLSWQIPPEMFTKVVKADTILQRFVFKPSKITELKSRVKSSEVPHPTRTVAIFALIWKIAMKCYKTSIFPPTETSPTSDSILIVNLRPRFKKPLPEYCIGNLYWGSVSHYDSPIETTNQSSDELKRLAFQLKKSIDKVDAEFIENLKGEMGHIEINKFLQGRGTGKDYIFTSIVKMGFNQVDFGWGKPIWVTYLGQTDFLIPYGACLMEATTYDNEVEALVSLPEKEMAIFEQDPQLLQYADVNPKLINSPWVSKPC
ncbi:Salutaridinol 7-O-acetyltransferase [Linum perenne]